MKRARFVVVTLTGARQHLAERDLGRTFCGVKFHPNLDSVVRVRSDKQRPFALECSKCANVETRSSNDDRATFRPRLPAPTPRAKAKPKPVAFRGLCSYCGKPCRSGTCGECSDLPSLDYAEAIAKRHHVTL